MTNRYHSYKPSGVDFLGDIPDHWDLRAAKYACRVIMGQSPSSDAYHVEPGERPFLQGNAEFGERSPTPKWYCDAAPKVVETGTLLLSVEGTRWRVEQGGSGLRNWPRTLWRSAGPRASRFAIRLVGAARDTTGSGTAVSWLNL